MTWQNALTGIGRTPFLVTVAPRTCECKQPAKDLGRFKRVERAIQEIEGYYAVYLGFFGDQQVWLDWLVTDLRDGQIVWRNGRSIGKGTDGNTTEQERDTGK